MHSTILIDAAGRVRWKRTGGDPFTDLDFILKTVKQMNKNVTASVDATKIRSCKRKGEIRAGRDEAILFPRDTTHMAAPV